MEYISSSARTLRMKENRMAHYPALPYSRQKRVQSTSIGWSLHLISCSFLVKLSQPRRIPFFVVSVVHPPLLLPVFFLCLIPNRLFFLVYTTSLLILFLFSLSQLCLLHSICNQLLFIQSTTTSSNQQSILASDSQHFSGMNLILIVKIYSSNN